MGSVASSLTSATWQATPAALTPSPCSHQSSPSLNTILLDHGTRTLLVRLPESYDAALAAARKAFALSSDEDVRLEVEWGSSEDKAVVELTKEVWDVVQPGSKVFVRVERVAQGFRQKRGVAEEQEEEARKRACPSQPPTSTVDETPSTVAKSSDGDPAPETASKQDVKGKGKAVDQDEHVVSSSAAGKGADTALLRALLSEDPRHAKSLELLEKGDLTGAKNLFLSTISSSSSADVPTKPSTCPHGSAPTQQYVYEAYDDADDSLYGDVLLQEHSGPVAFRLPYEVLTSLTVDALYSMVERKTGATDEFTLVHNGCSIDRSRGYKNVSKWGVQGGDSVQIVHTGQVIVQVFGSSTFLSPPLISKTLMASPSQSNLAKSTLPSKPSTPRPTPTSSPSSRSNSPSPPPTSTSPPLPIPTPPPVTITLLSHPSTARTPRKNWRR
jgi:hypothetical protein